MSAQLGSACSAPAVSRVPAQVARPDGWIRCLFRWIQVTRSRAHLAELDEHLLRDIGISRPDAAAETRRSPWDTTSRRP
ncbi:DUF1127 domain-containing protein [Roseomonas sp. 18066]|uniref:DUF1127 domain-containing protein n=1 Tax=Roseomonas sp. 18066 TaxID=2681412 RepID=UPI001358389D|nr:DUF1127 domain-containing protein [Roseomonas sp. 18066]